ncbi:uncharacterized protein LOC128266545 [Drosophila gunungcola]|uniref:uncharacterized protein LOC128266545 n=1 Tax=Drosophila gunungcola TaxID=103775 RepID=UPI0022E44DAD|nr:uncharacterized protein LOC128266545 [Drosophila gunungcola]
MLLCFYTLSKHYFFNSAMWFALQLSLFLIYLSFPKWVCTSKLKNYLDLDLRLMTQLKSYSEDLQGQIEVLNNYIYERRAKLAEAENDRESFLGNPFNSYSLLHHMHFDWQSWRMLMEEPLAEEQIDEIRDMLTHIPTKGEFMNSIKGAIDFQSGENPNSQTNREDLKLKFSPLETLEIAQYVYDQENFEQAEMWLNRTLKGYKEFGPQQKKLYEVISPVSESQVQDLYEKVLQLRKSVA